MYLFDVLSPFRRRPASTATESQKSDAPSEPEFDPIQQAIIDVLCHIGTGNGVRIKQLATRCKVSCREIYQAAKELDRLGYVQRDLDARGRMRVRLHWVRQPVKPPDDDPIVDHVRLMLAILNRSPVTEYKLAARCCEFPKDVRNRLLTDLVYAGCLQPCLDSRGIPAFRATLIEQVEKGLDAIAEAKGRKPRKAKGGWPGPS